jgi:hypothetical protein
VSYLAQTRKLAPVILDYPECADGAADADSLLLIPGRRETGSISSHSERPHPANRHFSSACPPRTCGGHDSTLKRSSDLETRATPPADERVSPLKGKVKIMPLIQLLEVLIVVGVLLWLVNRFIPMQSSIKSILNGVVVIAVVLWLLNVFGLFHSLSGIRLGKG